MLSHHAITKPALIEPAINLTCSIVYYADFPLTNAGGAVCDFLVELVERRVRQTEMPGAEWIAKS